MKKRKCNICSVMVTGSTQTSFQTHFVAKEGVPFAVVGHLSLVAARVANWGLGVVEVLVQKVAEVVEVALGPLGENARDLQLK